MAKDRIIALKKFLEEEDGKDGFTLYALAMEYASAGELDKSVEMFNQLLHLDAGYVPAYQQYAKVLSQLRRYDQARHVLKAGIPHAERAAQFHARDKMRELISELPDHNG